MLVYTKPTVHRTGPQLTIDMTEFMRMVEKNGILWENLGARYTFDAWYAYAVCCPHCARA